MSDVKWQEPGPKRTTTTHKWDEFEAALRKHPGRWAIASEGHPGNGQAGGASQTFRRRGLETTTRMQADGTVTLFVRCPKDENDE